MKIKKQLKRDIARRKKLIITSLIIMVLMAYLVIVLNDQGIFNGWEVYFVFGYVAIIDLLLLINIIRIVGEDKFEFSLINQRIKIKDGVFRSSFIINAEKILYIDVIERDKNNFEIFIVMGNLKRNKTFKRFDNDFIKGDKEYKGIYNLLNRKYDMGDLCCYSIKKAGAKKYYYLYLLYKNTYYAEFSKLSLNYVKTFMEEYNLS